MSRYSPRYHDPVPRAIAEAYDREFFRDWPAERRAAFECGRAADNILSNPYPDNSLEARLFVDGWVSRFTNP